MIPNYTLDSTVRKHIETLAKGGVDGWGPKGARYLDWTERQRYVLRVYPLTDGALINDPTRAYFTGNGKLGARSVRSIFHK